jgi:HPt (histidine-containing phosphotransfer) domain-containing protein
MKPDPRESAAVNGGGGSAGSTPLDLEQLESMCMGIPTLRDSLLDTFLGEIRPRLELLTQAYAGGDARQLEFEAHRLRSMSATIGARACATLFGELEAAARANQLTNLNPILKRVTLEVFRAEQFIATLERGRAA